MFPIKRKKTHRQAGKREETYWQHQKPWQQISSPLVVHKIYSTVNNLDKFVNNLLTIFIFLMFK